MAARTEGIVQYVLVLARRVWMDVRAGMKSSFTMRVEKVDMEVWLRSANLAGLSISEWARRGLNQYATPKSDRGLKVMERISAETQNAASDSQDLRDAGSDGVAERGTGSPGGAEKRVSRSASRKPQNTLPDRKTMICEHAAAPGFCKHSSCRNHVSKARR
jgi:hypothetical protein